MSGSYDRPVAARRYGHAPERDEYGYELADPPTGGHGYSSYEPVTQPPASSLRHDTYAPDQGLTATRQRADRPAGSVTGRSLTLVVSIMCFFACLTAGAVYLINKSAAAWFGTSRAK